MVVSRIEGVDFSAKRFAKDLCTKIPPTFETPTHARERERKIVETTPALAYTDSMPRPTIIFSQLRGAVS
jgi:hypothetical protein